MVFTIFSFPAYFRCWFWSLYFVIRCAYSYELYELRRMFRPLWSQRFFRHFSSYYRTSCWWDFFRWWVLTHELVPSNTTSINNNIDNNADNGSNGNKEKSGDTNWAAGQREIVMQSTPAPAPATVAPLVISLPKKNAPYSSSINKTNVASISSSFIFSSDEEEEEYIPTSAPAPSSSKCISSTRISQPCRKQLGKSHQRRGSVSDYFFHLR